MSQGPWRPRGLAGIKVCTWWVLGLAMPVIWVILYGVYRLLWG